MKKQTSDKVEGFGLIIPPAKQHVIIYFMQKGQEEISALQFYHTYSIENWCNKRGQKIKNWKMHAWDWIWSKRK